jgi:hypothetical protein
MTRRYGTFGKKYNRIGVGDPRGQWERGVGASAGFRTATPVTLDGVVYAGDAVCPPGMKKCPDGTCTTIGLECVPFIQAPNQPQQESRRSSKLSRHGAQKTRLKHGMTRRRK